MRCTAARVFIQEALDGPLSPPDEAMLEAHMAGCEPCRAYRHTLSRIATGLGRLESCSAPRDFGATVTFRLVREKRRRQWAPIAAAAALVAGFVTLKPLLGGTGLQVASQDAIRPAATVNSNLGVPGGSILDMPARPGALFVRRQPAAAPESPTGAAEPAPEALAEREAVAPLRVAAAGPGTLAGAPAEERAAGELAPDGMPLDAAEPDALAQKEDSRARSIASLPFSETKTLEAAKPAAPPAAMSALSAYRSEAARRGPAAKRRPLTPEDQMAVDMATFEMLRWMDPAADGGPHLEFQEVDFTLP